MPWYVGGAIVLWIATVIIHAKSDEEPDNRTPDEREREERFWDHTLQIRQVFVPRKYAGQILWLICSIMDA